MLRVSNLSYGVDAYTLLDGFDLAVEAGELVALVGPNGAGKTTALELMAGDLVPSAGNVAINGVAVATASLAELALVRALLPAVPPADVPFTVREVVELGRRPHGDTSAGVVDRCLADTDTLELARRIYRDLSTGEQARVTLARILAQAAPLLLLDEPTVSLDVRHAALVMETLRQTAAAGAAVVAVLHDLNLAAAYADRVVVLDAGAVAASGTPAEVFSEELLSQVYAHPVKVIPHPFGDAPVLVVS